MSSSYKSKYSMSEVENILDTAIQYRGAPTRTEHNTVLEDIENIEKKITNIENNLQDTTDAKVDKTTLEDYALKSEVDLKTGQKITDGGEIFNDYENNKADGKYSHAGGLNTKANGYAQTAIGKYNVANDTDLFIVGNGESDTNRSNAFTVDKEGNVKIQKALSVGSINSTGHGLFANGVTSIADGNFHYLEKKADKSDLDKLSATVETKANIKDVPTILGNLNATLKEKEIVESNSETNGIYDVNFNEKILEMDNGFYLLTYKVTKTRDNVTATIYNNTHYVIKMDDVVYLQTKTEKSLGLYNIYQKNGTGEWKKINTTAEELTTEITNLNESIEAKADKSDVDELSTTVDKCASDISTLENSIKEVWKEKTIYNSSFLDEPKEGESILSSFSFIQTFGSSNIPEDGFYRLNYDLSNGGSFFGTPSWSYKHTHLFIKSGNVGYLQTVDDEDDLGLKNIYKCVYSSVDGFCDFVKINITEDELNTAVSKLSESISLKADKTELEELQTVVDTKADKTEVEIKTQHYNAITDILTSEAAYYDYGLYAGKMKDGIMLNLGDTVDCDFCHPSGTLQSAAYLILEDLGKDGLTTDEGYLDNTKAISYGGFKDGIYKGRIYTKFSKTAFKDSTLKILEPIASSASHSSNSNGYNQIPYLPDNIIVKLNGGAIYAIFAEGDYYYFVGSTTSDYTEYTFSSMLYENLGTKLTLSIFFKIIRPENKVKSTFELTYNGFEEVVTQNDIGDIAKDMALSVLSSQVGITYNFRNMSTGTIKLERNCLYFIKCSSNMIISDSSGNVKTDTDGDTLKSFKNVLIMTVSNSIYNNKYQDLAFVPSTSVINPGVSSLSFFTDVTTPDSYIALEDTSSAKDVQIWKCKLGE